jgi:uncharacterized protein (TIGR02246 family)
MSDDDGGWRDSWMVRDVEGGVREEEQSAISAEYPVKGVCQMKQLLIAIVLVLSVSVAGTAKANDGPEQAVRAFYAAFNAHDWSRAADFTSDEWVHINPFGGIARGRENVLRELHEVHATFLKGVKDTPEAFTTTMASADVAIVIVPSRTTTFTTPDGVKHENERLVRTFVVVRHAHEKGGKWLIMHDQNTIRKQ